MKKGLLALLALACLLLTGCQYISLPVGEERAAPYLSVAKQVEEAMAGGDFEAATAAIRPLRGNGVQHGDLAGRHADL